MRTKKRHTFAVTMYTNANVITLPVKLLSLSPSLPHSLMIMFSCPCYLREKCAAVLINK